MQNFKSFGPLGAELQAPTCPRTRTLLPPFKKKMFNWLLHFPCCSFQKAMELEFMLYLEYLSFSLNRIRSQKPSFFRIQIELIKIMHIHTSYYIEHAHLIYGHQIWIKSIKFGANPSNYICPIYDNKKWRIWKSS